MIGIVLGTQDATPLEFWFAVKEGVKVQLDDVIVVTVPNPEDPSDPEKVIKFYGVVDQVRKKHEGVGFDSDTQMVVEGLMPANVSYAAHVLVTRVEPEDFIPPGPGDATYQALGAELERALYFDNMENKLPCGVLRNDEAGFINFDFVSGEKGAHINISGISGVATKTSYALFLLHSIFSTDVLQGQQVNSKAVVFNVKGEDLFFLDKHNQRFRDEENKWKERRNKTDLANGRFDICGLPAKPFESVGFFAPSPEGTFLVPSTERKEGVSVYLWTLNQFARERMLPFVLVDRDSQSNLGFLVQHITEKLAKMAEKKDAAYIPIDMLSAPMQPKEGLHVPIAEEDELGSIDSLSARIDSFDALVKFLEHKLLTEEAQDWLASSAIGTRQAFIRRLIGAEKHLRGIIRGDVSKQELQSNEVDILKSSKQILVVDIHSLAPLAQMFVVGVLLKQLFEKQEKTSSKSKYFVVLDELNKYAPSEGDSPIKDVLLDIAERGRSLGVILIGAQQTASEVERRIVSNAAVRVVGRLDAAEGMRSEYSFLPGTFRQRSTILSPGTMVVHQPDVPSPMIVTFPYPAWATREKETYQQGGVLTTEEKAEKKETILNKFA